MQVNNTWGGKYLNLLSNGVPLKQINNIAFQKLLRISPYVRKIVYLAYTKTKKPIFILGNQKAGTSVVAALLGKAVDKSVAIDIGGFYEPVFSEIFEKKISLNKAIDTYAKIEFSKKIIKEPNITLLYDQLKETYPDSQYIFIVRDPFQNIRSILNRVKLSGNKNYQSSDELKLSTEWHKIIFGDWLGFDYKNYVHSLALRWCYMVDIYLNQPDQFILVKYEDFLADKIGYIDVLAERVGYESMIDISDSTEKSFQIKGNRQTNLNDFFEEINYDIIKQTCLSRMKRLNYL